MAHETAPLSIALGSDEATPLTDALLGHFAERGDSVERFGAIADGGTDWPAIARAVGTSVREGRVRYGVVCCWTGTGVSIAANKVAGVRAALCGDAETARGARRWNDANVLALSLRATSIPVALEIVDAFLTTQPSDAEGDRRAVETIEG
jgi:ribose 5-phosphate isomerase B